MGSRRQLADQAKKILNGRELVVVSNREPWIHHSRDDARRSPGGLVTALEPVLEATRGRWIAHGSGDADFDVVDAREEIEVPPGRPSYALSRVRLTRDEIDLYYESFSNQVLWPLCHLVFVRPRFSEVAWQTYQSVNRKFANRVAETAGDSAVVLVQDYHLALLPGLLSRLREDLTVAIFWHIPWPPAEVFETCPWAVDLIRGMSAASLVGFHTESYVENFLDSARRVGPGPGQARVAAHPISIAWPAELPDRSSGRDFLRSVGIDTSSVILGVDRIDYTKGIPQRLDGYARFLRENRDWRKRVTYVQLGSPSRTGIEEYETLGAEVEEKVAAINSELGEDDWKPVVYEPRNIPQEQLQLYLAGSDCALVTPLHDGMNLVAKEYVAACVEEDGALVLSERAGAAEELAEAILVNPWSEGSIADGVRTALEMGSEERRSRMRALRKRVRSHDVFDWAEDLLADAVGTQ